MPPRRLLAAPLALATALALAPAAHAKEIASLTVCGADGCARAPVHGAGAETLMQPPGAVAPAHRAPYFRIIIGFGVSGRVVHTERVLYSPRLRMIAGWPRYGQPGWDRATPQALAVARRITRDRRPFPASRMPLGVTPASTPAPVGPAASPAPAVHGQLAADDGPRWWAIAGPAVALAFAFAAAALRAIRRRSG